MSKPKEGVESVNFGHFSNLGSWPLHLFRLNLTLNHSGHFWYFRIWTKCVFIFMDYIWNIIKKKSSIQSFVAIRIQYPCRWTSKKDIKINLLHELNLIYSMIYKPPLINKFSEIVLTFSRHSASYTRLWNTKGGLSSLNCQKTIMRGVA